MPIAIEEGKTYFNEKGQKVKIVFEFKHLAHPLSRFPFLGIELETEQKAYYSDKGMSRSLDPNDWDLDLVKEV